MHYRYSTSLASFYLAKTWRHHAGASANDLCAKQGLVKWQIIALTH